MAVDERRSSPRATVKYAKKKIAPPKNAAAASKKGGGAGGKASEPESSAAEAAQADEERESKELYEAYVAEEKANATAYMIALLGDDHDERVALYESVFYDNEVRSSV